MISGPRWVIFCIFSEFYFPILKKFFDLNFWPKNFDPKNWFFDGLKYGFSWLAHHAESYSAFLVNSIFQFEGNFFHLNFWQKNFDLQNWFSYGLKYSFSWSADHAESYPAFLAISIFQFQRNFFHLNFWPKNYDLKIFFFMCSNIVFRDERITLSHFLHF